MKILVIDDEPGIRELIRLWCEQAGHTVHEAENGKEGIRVQADTPADLLICDLIMPEQEGIETITFFRRHYPAVGIIAISGGGRIDPESYLEIAGRLGAWKTFSKPFDGKKLVEALQEWQERKRGA